MSDWHGPLPELPAKWAPEATRQPASLPSGHPLAWDDLVPYERERGGYWLYGTDPHGADKQFIRVTRPAKETDA